MKKTFIIVVSLLLNLVFTQNRDCSEIFNSEECYDLGCEWIVSYEEIGNELILTEECFDPNDDWDDNENYCEGLTEDECFEAEGCQWYDGEGCYRSEDDDDNNDDNDDWDDNCLLYKSKRPEERE